MHYLIPNNQVLNEKSESNKNTQLSMTSFSLQSSTGIVCRICYGNEKKEALIRPCNCAGTMGTIHKSCLEKWLASSNSNQCEICSYKFTLTRTPKPFVEWLINPTSLNDYRNFKTDMVCFLVLTPVAIICAWLCVFVIIQYDDWENKWEACGIIVSTFFVMLIYTIWCIIAFRYNYKIFKEWQTKNHIVSLNEDVHSKCDGQSDTHTLSMSLSSTNENPLTNEQPQVTTINMSDNDVTNFNNQEAQQQIEQDNDSNNEHKAFLI